MNIKMTLHSAEEFTAAAAFCTALAEARRKEDADRMTAPEYAFGIDRAMNSIWRRVEEPSARTVVKEDVTAGEIVDALHGALKAETTAEDADGVEFPAAATESPKKRGRPRKEAPVIDEEPSPAAEPEQLDIEDAIAAEHPDVEAERLRAAAAEAERAEQQQVLAQKAAEEAARTALDTSVVIEPEDPTVGWTTQDARNAGRALLDRAPDVDTGNRKLAATLVPFGVQQVKALQPDQIEAFVVATQKAVF